MTLQDGRAISVLQAGERDMDAIQGYIEDHAREDIAVHLQVDLTTTGYRARLLDEKGRELLDRQGNRYMIGWGESVTDAVELLKTLAEIR